MPPPWCCTQVTLVAATENSAEMTESNRDDQAPSDTTRPEGVDPSTVYAQLGEDVFRRIVADFYQRVRDDDVLAPMYPPEDFEGAQHRLFLFVTQYWGGPSTYSQERGHPRLRMRHAAFHVNPEARDRWIEHMSAAVRTQELPPVFTETLLDYFDRAAHAMVNTFEPTPSRATSGD